MRTRLPALAILSILAVVPQARAAEVKATPEQLAYADRLDKAFLEAGLNVKVRVSERSYGNGDFRTKFPHLTLDGHFTRADVYQVQKQLNVIGAAKRLGFAGLEFSDSRDLRLFDLSKDPTCSYDLCFTIGE